MRIVAAQPIHCGKLAPELAKARKDFLGAGQASDLHHAVIPQQVDLVAFLQPQLANQVRRQTDSKGIPPFRNLHYALR
jgi:hypothetical protein